MERRAFLRDILATATLAVVPTSRAAPPLVTDWWLGSATATKATLCVRGAQAGSLRMNANGSEFSAVCDPSKNDGIAIITATGLAPRSRYPFSLYFNNVLVAQGSLKTFSGTSAARLAFMSCIKSGIDLRAGYLVANDPQPVDAVVSLGDMPYGQSNQYSPWLNYSGIASKGKGTNDDPSLTNFYVTHRAQLAVPGLKAMIQEVPLLYMADDHEWPGDNWDHTVTSANWNNRHPVSMQAEVDALFWRGRQANYAYGLGNPRNKDSNARPEKPFSAEVSTPLSHYNPHYFRFDAGAAECFVLDCIGHRHPIVSTAPDKTMLGRVQKAWLKSRLIASDKTFKLIFTPKKLYPNYWDNGDGWSKYVSERQELINFMLARTRSAQDIVTYGSSDVTGIVWLSGDRHCAAVTSSPLHAEVCACPASQTTNDSQGFGLNRNVIYLGCDLTTQGEYINGYQNFGIVDINSTRVRVSIKDLNGTVRWQGQVIAGSNVFSA
jgi:hypothetical protein